MGYVEMRPLTSADELWICDSCNQEGVRANGKEIQDNKEVVMWFCFNCTNKAVNGQNTYAMRQSCLIQKAQVKGRNALPTMR